MQAQAAELANPETPLIRADRPPWTTQPPDGVNLLVAYAARAGLNHEDAWVLSDSVASRLAGRRRWTRTLFVAAVSPGYRISIHPGDEVETGQTLVEGLPRMGMLTDFAAPASGTEGESAATPPEPRCRIASWGLGAGAGSKASRSSTWPMDRQ